jgi:phosphoglycerol transferase MdoB-like AlkP superfamily enzyme
MLKKIKLYLFYFLFWIVYFIFVRALFLVYHFEKTSQIGLNQSLKTFLHGIRLDASMAGYICIVPFFLLSFSFFSKKIMTFCLKTTQIYTILILTLVSILITVDLELYQNWGYRIDDSFLKYLASPKEMMASSSSSPIFLLLTLGLLIFAIGYFFVKKFFNHVNLEAHGSILIKILRGCLGLLLMFSLILPMRGGFQLAPINQSAVYFSNNIFANHAAINPIWNFMVAVFESTKERHNSFDFYTHQEAEKIIQGYLKYSDSTDYILKKNILKPNIIFVTWESFTAKATKCLGNLDGVTPQFDSLVKEGVLFKNIFSSGDRTHLGLMATLGGQPAICDENILENHRKTLQMPILSRDLKQNGYETGFYYGGDAAFANMKSYLLNGQFNHLITQSEFEAKDLTSKWGAFDHLIFEKSLQDLPQYQQPFFINILTLTSHEPFQAPPDWVRKNPANFANENEAFSHVMRYTDDALGQFIRQCKQQKWWANTLIVISADHGTHRLDPVNDIDRFKIPVLFLGGALAKQGVVVETVGSQTDIAPTILAQLNIENKHYRWSKNLFSKQLNPFAYFSMHNAFGFASPNSQIVFDTEGLLLRTHHGVLDSANIKAGKAFLQLIYDDFLK